jgi:hypothetical protein
MAKAKTIVAKATLVYIFYLRAKARSKTYNINVTTLPEERRNCKDRSEEKNEWKKKEISI